MLAESASSSRDQNFNLDALQIIKGATWYGLGMAVGAVLEYATQGLVASQLGPSDFGIFSVGLQIFTFGLMLATLALPNAVARFIPSYQAEHGSGPVNQIIATSLWLNLVSSLLVGGVLFLAARPIGEHLFHEQRLATVLQLLALAVPSSAMVTLLAGALRGLKMSRQASVLIFGYDRALRLGFVVVFLLIGLGLRGPALAYLPASVLVLVLGLRYMLRPTTLSGLPPPAAEVVGELFRYAWPLLLSQLLARARLAIQPLLLAYFLDARSAGIYTVAWFIAESFSLVVTAFNFLYLPVISGVSTAGNVGRVRRLYRLITNWALISILPTCLLVVVLPETFLGFFGAHYDEGAWALRLLVVRSLMNVGAGVAGATLLATERTRTYLWIGLIGTAVSGSLGLLLIPALGLVGAATAQMLASAVWNGLTLLVVYRMYRMQPFSHHHACVFIAALTCLLPLYPALRLVIGLTRWAIIGVVPLHTGLTILALLKLNLLDADSQIIASEFLAALRGRLVSARTRLFGAQK
jgi:O-antigen/teichoic acid export membrane protein